jgi:hypothetical protein
MTLAVPAHALSPILALLALGFVLGMALSTVDIVLAKRRFFHSVAVIGSAAGAPIQQFAYTLFSWLSQQRNNPDLQVVEFTNLTGSNTVIADAACKLYAIVLLKSTTTEAHFKGSDNATTSSSTAPDVALRQNTAEADMMIFPRGLAMANGFTVSSDTTADGNTGSSAGDGAAGVVLLGAA